MWFAGLFAVVALAFAAPNPIIVLIALLAAYETWRRMKSSAAPAGVVARVLRGHAAPAPGDRRRLPGLVALLVLGMDVMYVERTFADA